MTSTELPAVKDRNILIRASAGTGKTLQLAERYISLLRDTHPERILATTFTRKAAAEILQRILLRLASDDAETESTLTPEELQSRRNLLRELTRKLHRVHIGTLDSFFINVGSAISLELGLPTGWRIIDEHERAQCQQRVGPGDHHAREADR